MHTGTASLHHPTWALLSSRFTLPKHTPSMSEKGMWPTCALTVVAAVSFSSSSLQSWEKMKSVRPMSWACTR